jgi:hypothetical protein
MARGGIKKQRETRQDDIKKEWIAVRERTQRIIKRQEEIVLKNGRDDIKRENGMTLLAMNKWH